MTERVERLRKFLVEEGFDKDSFGDKRQTFNSRNTVGDSMSTVYSSDGIQVDYAIDYEYLEIFGLTDEEYDSLSTTLDLYK